jgi:LysR family hydrogen peroxide-inducible transcriptional activator
MDYPLHPYSLRQLQYAVAVGELLNFRQAAERCHVSQPALSAQLAQLEVALGVRLFERDRRGVLITAAGAAFLGRARAVLREADELLAASRRAADPFTGTLRLGVIPTVAPYLLPEAAPALRARYPRLAFVWSEEKTPVLTAKLAAGEIDGAVLAREAPIGDVAHCDLGRDPFVLAAAPAHPLARRKGRVRLDELAGARVLLLDDGHCFRDQALAVCGEAHAEEAAYRATSLATLVQMAAGGGGLTLLPRLAVPVENRRDTLQIRALGPEEPARTLSLVWRKNAALQVTLKAVGETLKASYRKLVG